MTAVAEATIGHNSAAVGEILNEKPQLLFTEKGMLPMLVESLEKKIADHKPDLTTKKGRDAIASLAFDIAKQKNALDKAGKALNVDLRKAIDVTDKIRREAWDKLEALQAKARAPLDAWEKAEDDRKDKINAIRTAIMDASRVPANATLESIAGVRAEIAALKIEPDLFGDLTAPTESERAKVLDNLDDAKARLEKAEADRIELERLRAEKAEAERKAQEAAAAEAKKKAEEERIAAAAKAAAEKAAAEERQKAQAEAEAARAAQAKAIAEAEEARRQEAAKAQMAIDEANRKARAAEEALEAERCAEAAKVAAAAKAKAAQDALDAERQRNQEHRSRVMKAAKEAIMDHGAIKEDAAKLIILAIVGGSIPHVTLEF